jgi:hypothetical protein
LGSLGGLIVINNRKKTEFLLPLFSTNRYFSSSNSLCIVKRHLNEQLNSDLNTPQSKDVSELNNIKTEVGVTDKLSTAKSKDFFSNKTDKVKSDTLNTTEIKNGGSPKVIFGSGDDKCGNFGKFILKIKNYYRRTIIGVQKGLSVNTLPPKTMILMSHPVTRIFRILGSICLIICVTNKLVYFNNFIKYPIMIIYILYGFFLLYISIVRIVYIRKLIKAGAYEVRNSPLDRYGYFIAKLIACSKGACEFGASSAASLGALYTIDCVMKEIGFDPVFIPFLRRSLTNLSDLEVDPGVVVDKNNQILVENLKKTTQ